MSGPSDFSKRSPLGDAFAEVLRLIPGVEAERPGLVETPERAAQAWRFWCSGYGQNPEDHLKVFEDGAEGYDEMIVVRGIDVFSMCEHHLAPFFGTATIGYIPQGKVVGLSKLARVTEIFSRRLQVQERLTVNIADCLMEHLDPLGVGVVVKARHMCMCSRGVRHTQSETVTSSLQGVMRTKARDEFLRLAGER